MGKVLLSLSGLFFILFILQCAGTQKPDPETIAACKTGCSNSYDKCAKKAVKNQAKKAACEAVMTKCASDCELPPKDTSGEKKKSSY